MIRRLVLLRAALMITAGAIVPATRVESQASTPRQLAVRVSDSAGAPVAGAEITIVRGLNSVIAHATTDQSGRKTINVSSEGGELQAVARKIGFAPGSWFFAPASDTTVVDIVLHRSVQALSAVRVTAQEDLRRKSYFLDADAIANSSRPLLDGLDVFAKLRPDMLYSRAEGAFSNCTIQEVWVNGRRIPISPYDSLDPMIAARRKSLPAPHGSPVVGLGVLKTLSMIKPEHIAEINYHDCMDYSLGKAGDHNAAFITLKPGVAFDNSRGTYVVDQTVPSLEYRNRLLGLYDGTTGDPVPSASVTEVATGTTAISTATGTVTLAFLPDGKSTLKISKSGYIDLRIDVAISPRDTAPLTLILRRAK
jgi:hypothetical protein